MSLLHAAVGVFTISNPIGNLPIFFLFTNGNRRQDLAIACSAALTPLRSLYPGKLSLHAYRSAIQSFSDPF